VLAIGEGENSRDVVATLSWCKSLDSREILNASQDFSAERISAE
jgi:hypothetical protein